MQAYFSIRSTSAARAIVLCAALAIIGPPSMASASGVVGTGTAASCTDAALDTALAGGGSVTFDCGPDPVTIDISSGTGTKTIAVDTTIDGGSLITISGGKSVGVFSMNAAVKLTIENVTIARGSAPNGGGIFNDDGALTVSNCNFSSNSADSGGGGIANFGTLTVTNSTFSNNGASFGGGIANGGEGTLTVANSTFSANTASALGGGGGIFNFGTLTVTNSTFSGNIANIGGGGIANDNGTLTVTNCTFFANSVPILFSGETGAGGGISNNATLMVTNSTFSGNSAGTGGGIENGGTATLTNSTFSGNSATRFTVSPGGAIANEGVVTSINTLLAASSSGNCGGGSVVADGGHNLDDDGSCGFSSARRSLSKTNPVLNPAGLQDNGGPTQTIALLSGSPAIDAGDQTVCAAPPVNNRDQRNFVRPGSGHVACSIGAYEADALPVCIGDCNAMDGVTGDEIETLISILFGTDVPCLNGLAPGLIPGAATIVQAVRNEMTGCPS
jgi:hypothetical protein